MQHTDGGRTSIGIFNDIYRWSIDAVCVSTPAQKHNWCDDTRLYTNWNLNITVQNTHDAISKQNTGHRMTDINTDASIHKNLLALLIVSQIMTNNLLFGTST